MTLRWFEERTSGKAVHGLLVDRLALQGNVGSKLFGQRQLGTAHMVADVAGLLPGDLRLQQRTTGHSSGRCTLRQDDRLGAATSKRDHFLVAIPRDGRYPGRRSLV
jgi:hypothetical protein